MITKLDLRDYFNHIIKSHIARLAVDRHFMKLEIGKNTIARTAKF